MTRPMSTLRGGRTDWGAGSILTRCCAATTRPMSSTTWPRVGARLPIEDGDLAVHRRPDRRAGRQLLLGLEFSGRTEDGATTDEHGHPVTRGVPRGRPVTAMGWEIVPECFTSLLVRLSRDYPGVPMVITENGAAFDDLAVADGVIEDRDRVAYLSAHLAAVSAARAAGRRRSRLSRLVTDGQLRVVLRLREALRHRACRLRHPGAHTEAQRSLVRRHHPSSTRNPPRVAPNARDTPTSAACRQAFDATCPEFAGPLRPVRSGIRVQAAPDLLEPVGGGLVACLLRLGR